MREAEAGELRGVGVREVLAVAALSIVVAVVRTWPFPARLSTLLPGGLGDPLLNAWTLAWGSDRLAHGLQGFWTPPAFYPYPNALAYSENLLGISLLVAPIQWASGNLVLTYNAAFFLSFAIAAAGMFLLAHEVTGRRDAALVAAAAYAFCPYRSAQITHLQVLMSGWLPLALWALHRHLATARLRMLGLFVAAFVLQVLSNTYSLVFSLIPIAAVVGWAAFTRQAAPRAFRWLFAGAVAVVGALIPVVVRYGSAWRGSPDSMAEIMRYSANLSSYVQVTSEIWYSRWLPGPGVEEGNLFPGFIIVALTLFAVAAWRSRATATVDGRRLVAVPYLVAGVLAGLLSLGPAPHAGQHPLPGLGWVYRTLLAAVPGFTVLRVPARFGMVPMLSVALFAAMGAARLAVVLQRYGRLRGFLMPLLAAAVAAEGYAGAPGTSEFRLFRDRDERAAYTALRQRASAPMLELPVLALGREDQALVYQAAALFHHHRVVNGFSRKWTPLQDLLGGSASPFARPSTVPQGVELLQGLGVEYVVLHPGLYRDAALAEATIQAMSRDGETVRETWRSPGIAVFRLARRGPAAADNGSPLSGELLTATASANAAEARMVLDGDPATRWTTGRPQEGSEWLELSFDRPRDLVRLDLLLSGASLRDYPRDLEITALDDGGQWRRVYRGTTLAEIGEGLVRDTARVEARLAIEAPRTVRLRLCQHGDGGAWWWSVYDLRAWERRR